MKFRIYDNRTVERGDMRHMNVGYFAMPENTGLRASTSDFDLFLYDEFYDNRKSWKMFGYPLTAHLLIEMGHEVEQPKKPAGIPAVNEMQYGEMLDINYNNLHNHCRFNYRDNHSRSKISVRAYDHFVFRRKDWKRVSTNNLTAYLKSMGGEL